MFTLPLPNIYESIEKPLGKKIIDDLRREGFLLPYDRLDWSDVIESSKNTSRRQRKKSRTTSKGANLPDERRLKATIETTYEEYRGSWLSDRYDYTRAIFHDHTCDSIIRVLNEHVKTEFVFTMYTPSLAEIRNYHRNLQTMVRRGKDHFLHDASYHYTLPSDIYEWFREIYKLSTGETNEDKLSEYITNNSINELTVIQTATSRQLTFQENQIHIEGTLGITYISAITKLENGSYSTTLRYSIALEIPNSIFVEYPLLIKQQLIDAKFIPEVNKEPINAISQSPLLRAFTTYKNDYVKHVARIPDFDTYPVNGTVPHYKTILIILIAIEEGSNILLNLHDLVDAEIDLNILQLLKDHFTNGITEYYESPLSVILCKNGRGLNPSYITCDEHLNISLLKEVSLDGVYHLCVNLLLEPTVLKPSIINKVGSNPKASTALVDGINLYRRGSGNVVYLNDVLIPEDFSDTNFIYHCLPLIDPRYTDAINPTGELTTYKPSYLSPDTPFNVYRRDGKPYRGRSSGNTVSMKTVMTSRIKAGNKNGNNK